MTKGIPCRIFAAVLIDAAAVFSALKWLPS
jgi:hypothetical protein